MNFILPAKITNQLVPGIVFRLAGALHLPVDSVSAKTMRFSTEDAWRGLPHIARDGRERIVLEITKPAWDDDDVQKFVTTLEQYAAEV